MDNNKKYLLHSWKHYYWYDNTTRLVKTLINEIYSHNSMVKESIYYRSTIRSKQSIECEVFLVKRTLTNNMYLHVNYDSEINQNIAYQQIAE